jgi:hypothetical protein
VGIALAKIAGMRQGFPMSVAELKRAVDILSVEDRLELADYLRRTSKENDPQWQAEIGRRLDACLQHKGHTAEELLAMHDRLSADGR